MNSSDRTGFRIKLALTVVFGSVLGVVLVAGGGSGTNSALVAVLLLTLTLTALSLPVLVWLDARAVRREGDWSPIPWIWSLGCFVYGIPLILYLTLRLHYLGRLGLPLRDGLSDRAAGRDLEPRFQQPGDETSDSATPDKWALGLKWATAVLFASILVGTASPETSSMNRVAAVVLLGSYVATLVLLWLDASALRSHGSWAPRRWFWIPVTVLLLGLPVLAYLARRGSRQESTGPPLLRPVRELLADGRPGAESGTRQRDRTDSEEDKSYSHIYRDRLETGDSLLERGDRLKRKDQYVEAEDAFEQAADVYRSIVETLGNADGFESVETEVESRIASAERGADDCWMRVLADKVETAEDHLAAQNYQKARPELEQADSVLRVRSFDHHDTSGLERRVRRGLEAVE